MAGRHKTRFKLVFSMRIVCCATRMRPCVRCMRACILTCTVGANDAGEVEEGADFLATLIRLEVVQDDFAEFAHAARRDWRGLCMYVCACMCVESRNVGVRKEKS